MPTNLTDTLSEQVAGSLGVTVDDIHCTLDGNLMVITATGELRGRSVRYAARRRQRTRRIATRIALGQGYQVSMVFAVTDAISALEGLLRTAAELVLGQPAEDVGVEVRRGGRVSIRVALTAVEDDPRKGLRDAIAPLLRHAGLSLVFVSVVAPFREGVSDGRILRAAKMLAPCDAAAIATHLKHREVARVTPDTIHRRLDILRQRGLLVYLGDQKYALSIKGLEAVPTSNRRDSSDVERSLALAKRRW